MLKPPFQHGAVLFLEDVEAQIDFEVGGDPEDIFVESSVMQLAKRETIWNHGFAFGVPVWEDVRGIKQFLMP